MTSRKNISSGAVWEDIVGYSRAVRMGDTVEVSGTTATDGDRIIGEGSMYEQARYCLQKTERALTEAGCTLEHVVRTRMFVTDISLWEEAAKAHREFFGTIRPAATMVEVSALIDKRLLIEIETTAIAG